jgi:hypothetical protein
MSLLVLSCPDLAEYRGLSGLDTALVIELIGHALIAHDLGNGVTLLPTAHALGAVVGLAVYCALLRTPKEGRLTRSLTPQY